LQPGHHPSAVKVSRKRGKERREREREREERGGALYMSVLRFGPRSPSFRLKSTRKAHESLRGYVTIRETVIGAARGVSNCLFGNALVPVTGGVAAARIYWC
jgi:hypothetical protein